MRLLVTVKLPKNPEHDPRNKKTGPCPMNDGYMCTDVTGEHHTVLWTNSNGIFDAEEYFKGLGHHVTRIEELCE